MALRSPRSLDAVPQMLRPMAAALISPLAKFPGATADPIRLMLAGYCFRLGHYEEARELYRRIRQLPAAQTARLMVGWIDYKLGDYTGGWPEYPGKSMAGLSPAKGTVAGPLHIAQPGQPRELVTDLGLKQWQPGDVKDRPVLIWFNWTSSIGGEILAAKIVRAFIRKFELQCVLVVDQRLRGIVARNFPGCEVRSKTDDVAPLRNVCSSYLVARDALRHVIKEQADFDAIAAEDFWVDPELHPNLSLATRNVTFTWKTTNSEQGAYRNIPIDELIEVMRQHDLTFHSAQHGVTDAERARFRDALGDRVFFDTIDPTGEVERFAGQLKAMDALVTIDNSALHIGGAFGVPTYGLLSVPSYWAWPRSGVDSRWYSSVRLIHQQKPGHWSDVLGELSTALEHLSDASGRTRI